MKINYINSGKISITFTATIGDKVWFEIDGVVLPVETIATGEEQTQTLDVPDATRPMAIIMHESEVFPTPLYQSRDRWTKPIIRWHGASNAVIYKIYHNDIVIKKITEIGNYAYEYQIQNSLPDGWHSFRVEAVDQYGRESTRANWVFRVYEPPESAEVSVTAQGENIFRVSIGG